MKYMVTYGVSYGYQVLDSKSGRVVLGKGFGRVIPEWDNTQAFNAYRSVLAFDMTRAEAIAYVKAQMFRTAESRKSGNMRRKRV